MVADVNPVANVQAIAVNRDRLVVLQIRDEERDQFFRKLIGPVVIRATRDDGG